MALQTIDVDQHLFESRTTWSDHIDPADTDRRALHRRRRGGVALVDLAGHPAHPARGPIPERSEPDRGRPAPRLRGERAPASFDELVPDSYRLAGARPAVARPIRARCGGHVPQLRPPVGAASGLGPRGAAGQRAAYNRFMADMCGEGMGRLHGVAHVMLHDPDMGRGGDRTGARRGCPAGHDRPRARWTGSRCRTPDFDPVWAAFSRTGSLPCSMSPSSRARSTPPGARVSKRTASSSSTPSSCTWHRQSPWPTSS